MKLADDYGTSPVGLTCNSDSDVFRSVEVPSRTMQNQNVNVNAQKLKHSPTHLRLTATTTKAALRALHHLACLALHDISNKLPRRLRYYSAEIFVFRFVNSLTV